MKGSLRTGEWMRRGTGAAVLLGVGAIALGLDTRVLSRLNFDGTSRLEKLLVEQIDAEKPGSR